jgi:hypothetical protein
MELCEANQWHFESKPFTHEDALQKIDEGYIGFVYEITDNTTSKKYIGKKLLIGKRKLAPLKGQKRKRTKMIESDWQTYFGSSELVQRLVEERPQDFSREILFLCKTKGELSYVEAREQFAREVLLSDDYHNNFIGCKIHGSHVASLRKK